MRFFSSPRRRSAGRPRSGPPQERWRPRPAWALLLIAALAYGCSDPARTKAEAIKQGDDFVSRAQYPQAIQAYQAAVRADPKDGSARLKLSRTYKAAGRSGDWAREALLAADLLPENREAQLAGLESMLAVQRFVDVIDRATLLLERTPDDAAYLVLLGTAEARLGDAARALWMLDEAIRAGRSAESAWAGLRPDTSRAQDARAETALRRALAIAPEFPRVRWALSSFLCAAGRLDEGAETLKVSADKEPGDAFVNRTLGLLYEHLNQPADAEKYLKIAAAGNDSVSRLALADFYSRAGRDADALQILDALAAAEDANEGATLRAAAIEIRQNKPGAARKRVDAVLARQPHNPRALRIRAQVLYAEGDYPQAVNAAREAVAADPGSQEARVVLARGLARTGDLDGAFTEYAAAWRADTKNPQVAKELAAVAVALGRSDVALAMSSRSAQLSPNDPEAAVLLSKSQLRAGQFEAAEQTLAPLLTRQPSSPELLTLKAEVLAGRGRQDDARVLYLVVLQKDQDSVDALTGLVALEVAAGRPGQVRERVDQSAARHPKDPAYLLLAARVSLAEGNVTRAESTLRSALTINPAHVEAAVLLGQALARQNRREDARQVITQALTRRPSSVTLQVALANLLEDMGQTADARARYEGILAANPGVFAVSARLAALYANQGDNLDVALKYAQAAKQNLPKDPFVDDTLGWVYVRKDLPTLARAHLENAVRTQPDSALFRYHLGIAYERLGEVLKARDQLNRALALDPNFAGAADARAVLKTLPK